MASSRVHNKATAWCRPTMMATPQVTLMKATIGDRALEAASTALSRVVCTAARVTKGTTTHPTRTQSTCTETMKRTMICGNVPFMTVFGVFTFSPPMPVQLCQRCTALPLALFASIFGHGSWLGFTESAIFRPSQFE
jgi:hypothetical protein